MDQIPPLRHFHAGRETPSDSLPVAALTILLGDRWIRHGTPTPLARVQSDGMLCGVRHHLVNTVIEVALHMATLPRDSGEMLLLEFANLYQQAKQR